MLFDPLSQRSPVKEHIAASKTSACAFLRLWLFTEKSTGESLAMSELALLEGKALTQLFFYL